LAQLGTGAQSRVSLFWLCEPRSVSARALLEAPDMQQRPRKRSRLQFQPPFLIGALGALSMAAGGCNALVEDGPAMEGGTGGDESLDGMGGPGSGGSGSGGSSSECPEVTPLAGSSCTATQEGLSCGTWGSCSPDPQVTCLDGVWANTNPTCNPPPLYACPDQPQWIGSHCSEPGFVCVEATCAGDPGIVCGGDNTWQEVYLSCNPPPIGYGGADALGGASGEP